MIWYMYISWNNHHNKLSSYSSPHKVTDWFFLWREVLRSYSCGHFHIHDTVLLAIVTMLCITLQNLFNRLYFSLLITLSFPFPLSFLFRSILPSFPLFFHPFYSSSLSFFLSLYPYLSLFFSLYSQGPGSFLSAGKETVNKIDVIPSSELTIFYGKLLI